MIPYYLQKHLTDIREKKDTTSAILASSTGNTLLEILYYGDTVTIKRTPYITDGEYPCLIVARDPLTDETFTVFDGAKHGYDAMFCNEPCDKAERPLTRYNAEGASVKITLGYAIDYEDEKDDYDFTETGEVILTYGTMDWEKAKSIGFDWLSLSFVDTKKEFVDLELV
ncbi:MAG: hypothetical protein IJW46_05800 [Clostridia bacterium]|nr:hypothetical protein [Clostridia bacterium]